MMITIMIKRHVYAWRAPQITVVVTGEIHKEQDQSAREILKKTKTWNYKEAKSAALKAHENAFLEHRLRLGLPRSPVRFLLQ